MQFSGARPDIIRAINQRWLLKFWQRHLGAHRVPQWRAVEADDLMRMADNLSFLDVIGGKSGLRFQIRFHGVTVGRVYGLPDCRGVFLHESKPEPARSQALAPYRQAVESGRPVYLIHDVADRAGRLVHSERLLLPFSHDGQSIDRILASFEFVCPDGAFDNHGLMDVQTAPPTLRLSATIEPQAMA
jgi:hypothetical protein